MKAGAVDFLTKPTMSGRPAGGSQSISNTFFQPFPRYTTKGAWTFGLNAELMYDWTHSRWTVPINATVPKLTCIGKQALSLGAEGRYYADSPDACPHGWGARVTGMFLFFRMTSMSFAHRPVGYRRGTFGVKAPLFPFHHRALRR